MSEPDSPEVTVEIEAPRPVETVACQFGPCELCGWSGTVTVETSGGDQPAG